MTKQPKARQTSQSWQTVKRLVADLKPIAWAISIAACVCVASVILSVIAPDIVSEITDILYNYGKSGTPIDMGYVASLCIRLAVIYFGASVLASAMVLLMNNITSRYYTRGMRVRISEKILHLPVSFVDNTPNGELLSRMMDDVSNMANTIYVILETIINGIVRIVVITVILYVTNALMATAVIIFVPLSIFISVKISAKNEKSWQDFRKVNGHLYAFVEEDYTGFETVKSFNLEQRQKQLNRQISDEFKQKIRRGWYLSGFVQPIIVFTNNIAYIAVCLLGGYLAVTTDTVTVGDIVKVILLAKMFAGPLESIANGMSTVNHTLACASRVYELLDREEIHELPADENSRNVSGEVEFKNVYFSYKKDVPLIKNLNFTVKPGQKVAIVGPTGAGKTTIVNLLMRYYDVDSGTITVDGKDIMQMNRSDLRSLFSMVLQDTWLFNGTVYENIAYGKQNATREEVYEAAKRAHIDYFVDNLPQGYDTVINEETTNISGGQKQLLTIARSYLANKKMLILDEATSNVDTRTEMLIQQTMDELLRGRTSFVIAHRLSTIVNADVILVVNNGEIVEQGTHKELMQKDGFYTEIYNSQYELLK